MDLYKKLKQKITEEFDTETDDDGASSHVTGECQHKQCFLVLYVSNKQITAPQAFVVDAFLETRDHFKVLHRYEFQA